MQNGIKSQLDQCLVLLEEEYGYRDWFWFPQMTPTELIKWWGDLESVGEYFFTPEPLPGDVIKVTEETRKLYRNLHKAGKYFQAHIHMDCDSYLQTPEGKLIYHAGCTDLNQDEEG